MRIINEGKHRLFEDDPGTTRYIAETLGHKHIPVRCVGSNMPARRYPMFSSTQMSIIPGKRAGGDTVHVECCTEK